MDSYEVFINIILFILQLTLSPPEQVKDGITLVPSDNTSDELDMLDERVMAAAKAVSVTIDL